MNAGNWLENAVLNHFFRNTPTTAPSQVFVALFTSNPTDANTGMEVAGGGYVRRQITFTAPAQLTDGRARIQNGTEIRFPLATANWGNVTHFGIYTAATGGNLMAHGAVPTPKLIETGDEVIFRQNSLSVTLD